MSGIPPPVAQEAPAQDTPLQQWVNGWLDYLAGNLPIIFLVVAVVVGTLLLVRGGVKQTVTFAVGAAFAFLLLTNLESVAEFLNDELPLPADVNSILPGPPEPTATPETG